MGAKTWMLIYADSSPLESLRSAPQLDRGGTEELAATLFPGETLRPLGDGNLSHTCPSNGELHIGRFPGVAVVAAKEFGIDHPSRLPKRFILPDVGPLLYLHAMHSVVDWFAFAHWSHGTLIRSLSVSPDGGVLEDIGPKLPFELAYWAGEHPASGSEDGQDDYPLPFHPLDLAEAALAGLFGYQLEGPGGDALFDPQSVPLIRYERSRRRWWRLWT